MAFFDKLNQVAKNIGDKTGDAIETGKQNVKIHSERSAAAEELKKIGEFYYGVYASGGAVAPEVLPFCESAKAHYDTIALAEAEIERIKAGDAPAAQNEQVPATRYCPSCGTPNTVGTRFCSNCGQKLEG